MFKHHFRFTTFHFEGFADGRCAAILKSTSVAICLQACRYCLLSLSSLRRSSFFGTVTTMPPRVRKTSLKKKVTMARLDAFARGLIWGMQLANAPREPKVLRIWACMSTNSSHA